MYVCVWGGKYRRLANRIFFLGGEDINANINLYLKHKFKKCYHKNNEI